MSVLVTSYDNTFNNNVLRFAELMVTSQNIVSEIRITISKEEGAHILSTEVFVPSRSSLEDILRTDQGRRKMRQIEATNCYISARNSSWYMKFTFTKRIDII